MSRFSLDLDTGDRYYSPSAFKVAGDKKLIQKERPKAPTVYVSIGAKDQAQPGGEVEYILSLRNAEKVLLVELTFEVEDKMLVGKTFSGLNGFALFGDIVWTKKGDMWEGKAMLTFPGGFTSIAKTDIAKLVFTAKDKGAATLTVTDVKVTGVWEQKPAVFTVVIEAGEGTTIVINKYDANKDDKVNNLDLSITLYYFGTRLGDDLWDKVTADTLLDVKGGPIFAKYCDFNGDGIVDMVDCLEVLINYD